MDFLNKTFAQFSDLFRTMTPGARITAGLLLAVVVISLVYLFSYQMSSSDTYLLGGQIFQPGEMADIQAALGKNNLKCSPDGARIKIPRGRETDYVAALSAEGALPRDWNSIGDGIDDGGPFDSPDYRKQRMKLATEKDLAFAISQLDNVKYAMVKYDMFKEGGLRKKVVTSASVTAYPVGNRKLSQRVVNGIRVLVSGSLASMKPEDVNVINGRTGDAYVVNNDAENGLYGNRYFDLSQEWEQKKTNDIHKLLAHIPGVKVLMSVILDPTESTTTAKITPDKKAPATLTTTTPEITRDREGAAPGGRAGFSANQPGAIRNTAGRGSKENESESKSTSTNLVGQTNESSILVGMTPIWMAASVVVPHSYLVDIWKQKNPPPEGEDPKDPEEKDLEEIKQEEVSQIRELVATLFPDDMKGVTDKTNQVKVTIGRNIKPDPIPEPAMTSTAMTWLGANWGMIGVVVLAFASLGMLRSMIKSTPLESPAGQQPGTDLTAEMGAPAEEGGEEVVDRQQRRLARFAAGGASLRDELTEMVQEDPDVAANILRTWIGTSSMKV